MNKTLIFFLAILFLFGGSMIFVFARRGRPQEVFHASVEDADGPTMGFVSEDLDFVLTDQSGTPFDSKSLKEKVWIGSIFFSSCPSTCRIQNIKVADLQRQFADDGLEFVSITCDPETDTVQRLRDYSQQFSPQDDKWHFLTGDLALIKEIGGKKFGITVDDKVHSDRLCLFGRDGQLIDTYRSLEAKDYADLVEKLNELLVTTPSGDTDYSVGPTAEAPATGAEESQESETNGAAPDQEKNPSGEPPLDSKNTEEKAA